MAACMAKLFTLALLIVAGDAMKLKKAGDTISLKYFSNKTQGNPVAEVVTLLKEMHAKSKADGEEEAKLWSTFRAYCEDQNRGKSKSISDFTTNIAMLNSRIEELTAAGKRITQELDELAKDLAENSVSQKEAEQIRKRAAEEFAHTEEDLETRIAVLEHAIEIIDTVADPTALLASVGLSIKRKEAFLQAPNDHESQSGAVYGMLHSVLDTAETDLAKAKMDEDRSLKAHAKLMETLKTKDASMTEADAEKKGELASTNEELSIKQGELETDTKTKDDDEAFLANLLADCKEKTRINAERVGLRKGENEAIQTAIEILDSDRASKTFKKVSFGFFQINSTSSKNDDAGVVMSQVLHLLRSTAHETHSSRLAEVAALSIPRNPFNRVLKAIVQMKTQIGEEEKSDLKQFDLCKKNRAEGTAEKEEKEEQINQLTSVMQTLVTTMKEPETGLVDTIAREESELEENSQEQKEETSIRRGENAEYQKNIKNLVVAQDMLSESVNVLKAYYEEMAAHSLNSFLQVQSQANREAPSTAGTAYGGQSAASKIIGMLENIQKDAASEESLAHKSEGAAQAAFEDSMRLLTEQAASLRKSIKENKVAVATAEQDHISREKERDATEKELDAVTAFLHEIKPNCDFMEANYENRKASRVKETEALEKADGLIKQSPAYMAAEKKVNSQR
eukprot:TRINITY_DN799_c0_g1_i1.p1 TRINITY_DN799_c0_g1~~TRINITY_DN799_c0_g1_i1.p1  ORF type:complete len:712 (+),score=227.10 TRINITY_DN799_c0_g1_i1:94-2136(+)